MVSKRINPEILSKILCFCFAILSLYAIRVPLDTFLSRSPLFSSKSGKSHSINSKCTKAGENDFFCNIAPELQFTKFLWFIADGLPLRYVSDLLSFYQDHSHTFGIEINGPKYSHAIYTSFLTGQLPNNYQGKPIQGDSLIESFQRSRNYAKSHPNVKGMGSLYYAGPEWSFMAIIGKEKYKTHFEKIFMREEPMNEPHDQCFRFFFENDKTKKFFWKEVLQDNILPNNGSLITLSGIFDHMNHGVYREVC